MLDGRCDGWQGSGRALPSAYTAYESVGRRPQPKAPVVSGWGYFEPHSFHTPVRTRIAMIQEECSLRVGVRSRCAAASDLAKSRDARIREERNEFSRLNLRRGIPH